MQSNVEVVDQQLRDLSHDFLVNELNRQRDIGGFGIRVTDAPPGRDFPHQILMKFWKFVKIRKILLFLLEGHFRQFEADPPLDNLLAIGAQITVAKRFSELARKIFL